VTEIKGHVELDLIEWKPVKPTPKRTLLTHHAIKRIFEPNRL
jgi:hypothetical protein